MTYPQQVAGCQLLVRMLADSFAPQEQHTTIASLEQWDALHQPRNMTRSDFLLLYQMALEEAHAHGGFDMNDAGKSFS